MRFCALAPDGVTVVAGIGRGGCIFCGCRGWGVENRVLIPIGVRRQQLWQQQGFWDVGGGQETRLLGQFDKMRSLKGWNYPRNPPKLETRPPSCYGFLCKIWVRRQRWWQKVS